jgi:signal transduction histidine kinase
MRHKLGQVIALSRLVLASVFLLAIFIDPSQPSKAPAGAYFVLGFYVVIALALLAATWRNWWLDHLLARPAHWLDLAVFAAIVFATEGYTSPFFTFSLFLLLSAAIRWGKRETTRTAIAVNMLFLLAGLLAALYTPGELDLQRLVIRGTYLAVLSLLFVWYSMNDEGAPRYVLRTRLRGTSDPARAIELIMDHVAARLPSARLMCVWRQKSDGRAHACMRTESGHVPLDGRQGELAAMLDELPATPFLFDPANRRLLVWHQDASELTACPDSVASFLDRRGVTGGLAIPVSSEGLDCAVFAEAEVWADDLAMGAQLAEDIRFMHEQAVVNRLTEEAASAHTRLAVARDLHDSVAQLLAGISFRLEALKRSGKPAASLADELEMLQGELAIEQNQVRSLIAELRQPGPARVGNDMPVRLAALTERLAQQWGIECTFEHAGELLADGALGDNEIQQMVREGVANAVRHGKASHVAITLRAEPDGYVLVIRDNGCGLPPGPAGEIAIRPRSLYERTQALGGSLEASGDDGGTTIRIRLPAESGQ